MIKEKKSKGSSLFNWEDSYFGGYYRLLFDHPEVKVPFDILKRYPKDSSYSYMSRTKITDIFLLKIAQAKLFSFALRNAEVIEEKSSFSGFSFLSKGSEESKKYLKLDSEALEKCYNFFSRDNDLGNLLVHYKEIILNTQYLIEIPEDEKSGSLKTKSEGSSSDSSSSDDSKGEPKLSKEEYEQLLAEAKEILKKISVRKPWTFDKVCDFDRKTSTVVVPKSEKEITYTEKEKIDSDNLVKMLDISFDPTADRINSLRLGKLDMNKIAQVPIGNPFVYYKVEEEQNTKPFSICILCDESGSMQGDNYNILQHSLVKTLYRAFSQIMSPENIYVFGHSGNDEPELRVYQDKYNQNFDYSFSNQLSRKFLQNYDGPVIEEVYKKVRAQTSNNILFISISDGEPAGHMYGGDEAVKDLKRIIEKCKRDGFVTLGIGFNLKEIAEIYNHHCVITDFSKLVPAVSTAVNLTVKQEFKD